jgi:FkbM family methyltransferase
MEEPMEQPTTSAALDSFAVSHPGLPEPFTFSSSGHLDTIANTIRLRGLADYENPTTSIIVYLAQSSSGYLLDVGANTGLFSLVAAAANPLIKVISFEPLASVRTLLEQNIALNPTLSPRIAVEPIGLSNASGSFTFYETVNDQGLITTSSSLELGHAQQTGSYIEHAIVTDTLDDWSSTLGPVSVDFIKIDVEGHEHAVIEGGRRFLNKHRPLLSVEVLGPAETGSLNRLLVEGDYLALAMAPTALRQSPVIRFQPDAWNHLLCPVEKAGRIFTLCRQAGLRIDLL